MMQVIFEITTEFFAREADALQIKALVTSVQPGLPTRELFPFKSGLPKCMRMFCWWLFFKVIEPASSSKRPSGRLPTAAS